MVTEANAHEPVRELMESMEAWMLVNGPGNLAGEPAQALARLLPQRLAAANTLAGTLDGRTVPARFEKAAARLLVQTHAKHALGVERRDKEARDAVEAAIDLAKEYLGAARMRIEEPYCLLERDPARTHHCGTYRGAFGVYTDAREYAVQESRKGQQLLETRRSTRPPPVAGCPSEREIEAPKSSSYRTDLPLDRRAIVEGARSLAR
jgi:hypothetical protein